MTRQPEEEEEQRGIVVNQDNVGDVIEQMDQMASEEIVAPGYYTVSMNYEWYFKTGDAISENAYVENSPDMDRAIAVSDAYYGDHSSIVWLYRQTGKPIMIQAVDV
ncbi:MAG TPA: hypothetical protein DCZ91_21515 [Lachnospiraceae bacterium]|nr:hypothetical protein [Lachnospiraceae bacterium]